MYMLYTDVKPVSSTYSLYVKTVCSKYRVLYHIYMLFTAFFWSVSSTYRVNHMHLCIYASTDLNSASSTHVLSFHGMPLL